MSEKLILNSEIISDIISSNSLQLIEKYQRGGAGKNYFFTPTIAIKLYNPKITWLDSFKKNISFSFNKSDNLNLFIMLRFINQSLVTIYKKQAYNAVNNVSPFFYEKGDYFYIKCYLPNTRGKYHITSFSNNIEQQFITPRIGCSYNTVILDIKNIWEKNNAGFNLELKETHVHI